MANAPCPQAASAPAIRPPAVNPWNLTLEQGVIQPRPGPAIPPPDPPPAPDPSFPWPYHLPRWNAVDCFWWSLLARAAYSADSTFMSRVARWAGPVLRMTYQPPADPPFVGHAFIELRDQWLAVIPGTANEAELLQYFVSHALESLTTDPNLGWKANTTWVGRGNTVYTAANAWAFPEDKPMVVIGHSSGGATGGVMSAFRLPIAIRGAVAAITFGAPKWSTPSLSPLMNAKTGVQTIEFSMPADPVVNLPPPYSVLDLSPIVRALSPRPEYVRNGNVLTILGASGTELLQRTSLDDAVAAFQALLRGNLNLRAHSMAAYTNQADLWARAFAAGAKTPDLIVVLENILRDMNAANL